MHWSGEFGFRFGDHVFTRCPRRNVGEEKFLDAGERSHTAGFLAGEMDSLRSIGAVGPRRFGEQHVCTTREFDDVVAHSGVACIYEDAAVGAGDPETVSLGWMIHPAGDDAQFTERHRLVLGPEPDVDGVGDVVHLAGALRSRACQVRTTIFSIHLSVNSTTQMVQAVRNLVQVQQTI